MFCISDRLRPTYHHHHHYNQLQQPAAIFIPAAYDQQTVATMMVSMLPCGEQSLMTNFQPASLPPSSLTLGEFQQLTSPTPSRPKYDGLSPVKLRAVGKQQVRGTAAYCSGGTAGDREVTSFRIADILHWREGSSGRRLHRHASPEMETTALRSAGTTSIVRPWDQRRSSTSVSSSSSPSEVEERNDDVDDDEAAEIDVDDASSSLPGTASSSDRDVCPLGALLRMTNQTNFDECANRLQECFTDGWYIHIHSCMLAV